MQRLFGVRRQSAGRRSHAATALWLPSAGYPVLMGFGDSQHPKRCPLRLPPHSKGRSDWPFTVVYIWVHVRPNQSAGFVFPLVHVNKFIRGHQSVAKALPCTQPAFLRV
jgi:hypothetical protein